MVQFWSAVSVVVIIVPAAILMVWGWRRRVRRQRAAIVAIPEAPGALEGEPRRGKYVATTSAGDPYDRIAANGLAFRGFANVVASADGLLIDRDGERAIWIARDRIVGVDRATWTIDRVVERGGLHVIRWRLGESEVDTYLRIDEPSRLDADLERAGLPLASLEFPPTSTERRRAARRARKEASAA